MADRDDLMLEHLKAIREDLRVINARQLEHTEILLRLWQVVNATTDLQADILHKSTELRTKLREMLE
jgi:hypothetical protein